MQLTSVSAVGVIILSCSNLTIQTLFYLFQGVIRQLPDSGFGWSVWAKSSISQHTPTIMGNFGVRIVKNKISVYFVLIAFLFTSILFSNENNDLDEHIENIKNATSILYKKSIILDEPEWAYGPPSTPNINLSYESYLNKADSVNILNNESDKLYEFAYLAYQHGDYKRALKYFQLSENKNNFTVLFYPTYLNYWYGEVYKKLNNYEMALKYFNEYGDLYYIHLINAEIYSNEGKLEKAENEYLLAQSVELYEMANYEPYLFLAEMYYSNNGYLKAKEYIEKYIRCAEVEWNFGGFGYMPFNNEHILKAKKFLEEIQELGSSE